ncbi:MAG: outer membrane protein assembly factor BamB [Planctomycetota bacterium]|jgi:outer membrane protein assembly factor BamB
MNRCLSTGLLGGKGDVSESHRMWRNASQMSNCGSGVYEGGHVYVPDMGGILWCIDPISGEAKWKERVARGSTWGSIVRADGRMFMMTQRGTTIVFEASPEGFKVIAENE